MAPPTVFEISRFDVQSLPRAPASITDVKLLSSYNWLEASTPTISIPGSPALWSALGSPQRLKKDSGLVYIAQNAARHPESPLEPLFRALFITQPSFDIRTTDVVTDRNNIRKLLSFIDPRLLKNGLEKFTISVEVTKNTAIFCRDETKTVEHIGPQEFRGYGHEFEKAYTSTQVSGSTGHHRIISYRFADLNFIVRHETDGYVDVDEGTSILKSRNHKKDEISSMLEGLSLSPTNDAASVTPDGSKMVIKEEGHLVPLESTLEIKTRVFHKPIEIQEVAPQLWISQTPKLVRAYHQLGVFQRPVVEDVAAEIKSWEASEQNRLKKLAALILKIIARAKECGGKAVVEYNVEKDKLVVRKVESKEMLPRDLYSKWDDKNYAETKSDSLSERMQKLKIAQAKGKNSSTPKATGDDLKATAIKIGDSKYNVDLSKIPYLADFVRQQKLAKPEAAEFEHEPINLFDVALKGLQSGYRQCFRRLPTDLSQYRSLLETYNFLKVDVLNNLITDEIIANLKAGKPNYDFDAEEGRPVPSSKSLARDTAFQLLYLILHDQIGEDRNRDSMKLFNAVMFVVSHPRTFKHRTKRVIRAAYEEQFRITPKQRARLDQWEKVGNVDSETDATTEEEPERFCFDSDGHST
ncbi:MAG: hypothetical protein Q9227_003267 [Pyrenula ochraceoflavens]